MNYGRNNSWGNNKGSNRRKEMHHAICDECGDDCEVPFKPSNNKPIYCSDCFEHEGRDRGNRDRDNRGRRDNRNDWGNDRGRGDNRRDRAQMHHAVCDDCGDDCEVPFKPNGSKPIYCSFCFEDGSRENSRSRDRGPKNDKHSHAPAHDPKMHKELLKKLDTIIEILQDLAYEEVEEETLAVEVAPEMFEITPDSELVETHAEEVEETPTLLEEDIAPELEVVLDIDKDLDL